MARPQVFISSTYFDLKAVREDIARFLNDIGCDSIRHETGRIPYLKGDRLDDSCYREVAACDILICIVGGRFGAEAGGTSNSITQRELKAAIDAGKQLFIFVDRPVHAECEFYAKNRHVPDLTLVAASDKRIHDFLLELRELPIGYPTFPFDTSSDITTVLREQLAGLFQRLLGETQTSQTFSLVSQLQSALDSVTALVQALARDKRNTSDVLQAFLESNHPIFQTVATTLKIRFRVFFYSRKELDALLREVKGLKPIPEELWDSPEIAEWCKTVSPPGGTFVTQWTFKMPMSCFDKDGRLLPSVDGVVDKAQITYRSEKIDTVDENGDISRLN